MKIYELLHLNESRENKKKFKRNILLLIFKLLLLQLLE